MEKNKISVVVPVYNVEKYLKQCIDSLLLQTYINFDILLIDDGSTDSSGLICDEYQNKYEQVKVIHKINEGLGMARNTGIEYAQGEYITFFDSDDYAHPDLLKDLYESIVQYDADVCLGGFKKVRDDGVILFEEKHDFQIFNYNGVCNDIFVRMLGSLPSKSDSIRMSVWNTLYKLSIIKSNNIRFYSERQYISEDLLFDYDYYKYARKCIILPNSHYFYRYNTSSLTTSYRKNRFTATMFFVSEMEKRLIEGGYPKEAVLRLYKLCFIYVRMCINQESSKKCPNNFISRINNLKNICYDKQLNEIIDKYPVKQLKWKQRLFVQLIKYNLYYILYIIN